jgi:hypothetical protein
MMMLIRSKTSSTGLIRSVSPCFIYEEKRFIMVNLVLPRGTTLQFGYGGLKSAVLTIIPRLHFSHEAYNLGD